MRNVLDIGEHGHSRSKLYYGTKIDVENNVKRNVRKMGRTKKRLMNKDGMLLVNSTAAPEKRFKHFKNWFTYLLDAKWRFLLLLFAAGFVSSWTLFASLYYGICYVNGDFSQNRTLNHRPCVVEIEGFVSAFLFSLETQHTIGYGSRHITEACPLGVLLLCTQSVTGVLVQALLAGLVLAKMLRPKKRSQEIIFSHNAVICKEDGKLTLQFRVADITDRNIVEAHVRLYMVKNYTTKEGVTHNLRQFDMNVGFDFGWDRVMMLWPCMVTHVIDKDSPLHGITKELLTHETFELIAVVEGIVEATGMTFQVRSSYIPQEVLWNHRFTEISSFDQAAGQYRIFFVNFGKTYQEEGTLNPVNDESDSSSSD